jgi:hypothetical protein
VRLDGLNFYNGLQVTIGASVVEPERSSERIMRCVVPRVLLPGTVVVGLLHHGSLIPANPSRRITYFYQGTSTQKLSTKRKEDAGPTSSTHDGDETLTALRQDEIKKGLEATEQLDHPGANVKLHSGQDDLEEDITAESRDSRGVLCYLCNRLVEISNKREWQ